RTSGARFDVSGRLDVARMKIPLLVIAGPTGVGKTASAVALAHRVPLEVVSADSRQVYRRMDVATGKPTAEERAAVAHHLVDVVDPDDRYHAERFARDARGIITAIRERGKLPVVAGGRDGRGRASRRGPGAARVGLRPDTARDAGHRLSPVRGGGSGRAHPGRGDTAHAA